MKHILSARQFTPESHFEIFDKAEEIRQKVADPSERRVLAQRHLGRVVATLFYEPSTRTRLSFESAAARLGAGIISTENAGEYSSAIKGESIEDTTNTISRLADVMVLRHKEAGSATTAAGQNTIPVINGGDGRGEHPTQTLLDLETIRSGKGRLSDLTVVIGGDLANGRTARSLAIGLSQHQNNRLRFVSTPEYQIGEDIKQHLNFTGTDYEETDDMYGSFDEADVVYWTRLQRERLNGRATANDTPLITESLRTPADVANFLLPMIMELKSPTPKPPAELTPSHFIIDQAALQSLPESAMIMHPLPRVDEIDMSVDADPRAKYFDQVENGLYVRMALLDDMLTQE